jgi:thioester reductase-like protein
LTGLGTGEWSTDDLLYRMLRGSVDLGAVPDIDISVDMTPVDFVARAVVCGVLGRAVPPVSHLVNPCPTTLAAIADILRRRGYQLKGLPMAAWLSQAAAAVGRDETHPLYPLLTLLPQWADSLKPRPNGKAKFAWRNTAAALEMLDLRCPPIDTTLIAIYLDWFVAEGALPLPEPVS